MSGNSRGLGAASGQMMDPLMPVTGEYVRRTLKLAILCASAALFAFWLAYPSGRGRMPAGNCEIHGRGGAFCAPATAENRALVGDPDPKSECQSLGRGGLICSQTAGK